MKYPSERVEKNKHSMKRKEKEVEEPVPPHRLTFTIKVKLKLDEPKVLQLYFFAPVAFQANGQKFVSIGKVINRYDNLHTHLAGSVI